MSAPYESLVDVPVDGAGDEGENRVHPCTVGSPQSRTRGRC